jgi:hypothetical protein
MESVQASISSHMSVGDAFSVATPNLVVSVTKACAKNASANVTLGSGRVNPPTYCQMIGEVVNKTEPPPGTPITDLVYDPDEKNNCENKVPFECALFFFLRVHKFEPFLNCANNSRTLKY